MNTNVLQIGDSIYYYSDLLQVYIKSANVLSFNTDTNNANLINFSYSSKITQVDLNLFKSDSKIMVEIGITFLPENNLKVLPFSKIKIADEEDKKLEEYIGLIYMNGFIVALAKDEDNNKYFVIINKSQIYNQNIGNSFDCSLVTVYDVKENINNV
jgi:hypothetical protein